MKTRRDLTFQYNLKRNRHGWLRLTPAYSVKIVQQILNDNPNIKQVIDPFSGTGTTGLACAEVGIDCDLIDINPFLVWLAQLKTMNFSQQTLTSAQDGLNTIRQTFNDPFVFWIPNIQYIERWWTPNIQQTLAKLYQRIVMQTHLDEHAKGLLLIAFCQKLIDWSNASYGHQSVSFKSAQPMFYLGEDILLDEFCAVCQQIIQDAHQVLIGKTIVSHADSKSLITTKTYDAIITSPPYPNRMSYIRELRPYMYWLGYLKETREAGEMDWQTIGGTWGIATSRLNHWIPSGIFGDEPDFQKMVSQVHRKSSLLANYIHKYFEDIFAHLTHLLPHLEMGGQVYYVVGNSKFYDTLIPVETIYAHMLERLGMQDVRVETIRKRNSKKELFEFVVSAKKYT
jgi:hypothetical protein